MNISFIVKCTSLNVPDIIQIDTKNNETQSWFNTSNAISLLLNIPHPSPWLQYSIYGNKSWFIFG